MKRWFGLFHIVLRAMRSGHLIVNTLIFKSSDVGKKLKVVENGEVYRHVPIRRVM